MTPTFAPGLGSSTLRIALLTALTLCASVPSDAFAQGKSDAAFRQLVPEDAELEVLADRFQWAEGPAWRASDGYLLFTDVPQNTIYRWDDGNGLTVFMRPSGYMWDDPPGGEMGANGLAFDRFNRLVMADHGNRVVARLDDATFSKSVVAESFQGDRLNSPNDIAIHSSGDIYFTDPPYGLEGLHNSPHKELDFAGVYRVDSSGTVTLLTSELEFPNGIAFSPDEEVLYVANSDPNRAIWMAYPVEEDGSLGEGEVLLDATSMVGSDRPGLPDGMAIDNHGNLFATGPGGVLVITPGGQHLGTIETGRPTANCTFGDDGRSLFITADSRLLRIRVGTLGAGF